MFDDDYIDEDFINDDYEEEKKKEPESKKQPAIATNLNRLPTIIKKKTGPEEIAGALGPSSTKNRQAIVQSQSSATNQKKQAYKFELNQDSEDDFDVDAEDDDEEDVNPYDNNTYVQTKQSQQSKMSLLPDISKSSAGKQIAETLSNQKSNSMLAQSSSTKNAQADVKDLKSQLMQPQAKGAKSSIRQSQNYEHNTETLTDEEFYKINDSASASRISKQEYIPSAQQKISLIKQEDQKTEKLLKQNIQVIPQKQEAKIIEKPKEEIKQQVNQASAFQNVKVLNEQKNVSNSKHQSNINTYEDVEEEEEKDEDIEPKKTTVYQQQLQQKGKIAQKHLEDLKKLDPPTNFEKQPSLRENITSQQSKASHLDERRAKPLSQLSTYSKPPLNQQASQQTPASQRSESVERMIQINEKLKTELMEVINKMDSQLKKFEDKRRAKIEADLLTDAALVDKNIKIKMGQKKFLRLKQEVSEMWAMLEHSYNIELINKLEDDLKDKTNRLNQLKEETSSVEKISKEQNGALDNLNKNKENSAKMSNLSNQLRAAKTEFKMMKEQQNQENKYTKMQHEQIMKVEEKCKKITNMIKDQKMKNATQRSNATSLATDATKNRLEEEIKELEENKQRDEKKYKQQVGKLDSQLKQLSHELSILSLKLKEKEQEVKLNDLKIKELRKQVPNNKLKPLRKDAKVNMSLDSRLNKGELDSLVEEESQYSKRDTVRSRKNISRKIIRDGSEKVLAQVKSAGQNKQKPQKAVDSAIGLRNQGQKAQGSGQQSNSNRSKSQIPPRVKAPINRRKDSDASKASNVDLNREIDSQIGQSEEDDQFDAYKEEPIKEDQLLDTIKEEMSYSQFDLGQVPQVKNMQKPLSRPNKSIEEDQINEDMNTSFHNEDIVVESKQNLDFQESSIIMESSGIQIPKEEQRTPAQESSKEVAIGDDTQQQAANNKDNKNTFAKPTFMMKKKKF